MLVTFNKGPVELDELDKDDDSTFLPHEHLFHNRSCYVNASTEQRLDSISLANLFHVQQNPQIYLHNVVLESLDEVEAELAASSSHNILLVVCESSPPERDPQRGRLMELVHRLKNRSILCVVGTGWACANDTDKIDVDALKQRFIDDLTLGLEIPTDTQTWTRCIERKAGFIGEIIISAECTEMEKNALRAASMAVQALRGASTGNGPTVLVSLDERREISSEIGAMLKIVEQVLSIFRDDVRCVVWLSGFFHALPGFIVGIEAIHSALDRIIELFETAEFLNLVVQMPPSHRLDLVAYSIVYLAERGYQSRLCVSPNVAYKTDLRAYGGAGYIAAQELLRPRLQNAGLNSEMITQLFFSNAIESFSWWVRPAPIQPKKKPKWVCDCCGKRVSAKKEPFMRLDFKYCSMDCLRKHKEELEKGMEKDDKNGDGGGGKRAKANNNTSWGIAVGST